MKNYLIIGGSRGIGMHLAQQLTAQGHQVLVHSRATGFNAVTDTLPLEGFTSLDGLVYCPGTIRLKPVQRITDEEAMEDFQVNALGALRAIRVTLPLLRAAENPAIVLFSTVAVTTGMPFHSSIAMAKGAVEGLVRSLAAELAPKVRVNAIAPSLTDTSLAAAYLQTPEKRKAAEERHPLKRVGDPAEIASLANFLLSNSAQWITGQILHADGGIGVLKA